MGFVLFKLLAVSEGPTHLEVSGVLSSLPSDWRAEDLAAWTPYLGTLKVLLSSTSDLLNSLVGTSGAESVLVEFLCIVICTHVSSMCLVVVVPFSSMDTDLS